VSLHFQPSHPQEQAEDVDVECVVIGVISVEEDVIPDRVCGLEKGATVDDDCVVIQVVGIRPG